MLEDNRKRIKLILLGDIGVGKSSIIQRYHKDIFEENMHSTVNSNFVEKEIKIRGENLLLELWDTAGQEQYRSMTKIFVKNSKIIILAYDVTSKKTFEALSYWYDFISRELGSNVVLGLAGNKSDLIFEDNFKEEVTTEEGKEYAAQIGATFALISAKESDIEIKELINQLLLQYLDTKENDRLLSGTIKLDDRNFTREVINKNECCLGKKKKSIKLKAIFLGDNGVGKTSIIKILKGKENITNLAHTKKEYKENIHYTKNGQNITVELKEINIDEFNNQNSENHSDVYKLYFLVFDIYKKDSLSDLKNLINKIDLENKVYLLGYNNDTSENKISEFDYSEEAEKFAKKYRCEYEYITVEDIYKIKAIIIDNIGLYLRALGF